MEVEKIQFGKATSLQSKENVDFLNSPSLRYRLISGILLAFVARRTVTAPNYLPQGSTRNPVETMSTARRRPSSSQSPRF